MKKGLISCVTVLLCAGVLIAPASFAADKYEITASEVFDPGGIFGDETGEFLSFGTVKCPGYEPTGNPLQPCPVGSRQHTRDVMVKSRTDSSDPAMSGWMTVVLNSNLDADGVGPVWGTFRTELDGGGGIWEGTWQGLRTAEDGYWIAPLHVVGKGYGGLVDGMQMMGEDVIWSPVTPPYVYLGSIKVRILDPK
jgi:hypothetical protein